MAEMLKLIAMADAYGAGFEFARGQKLLQNTLEGYLVHNLDENPAGSYSDDTQMSLAVAQALMAGEPTELLFAQSFVEAFKRDPRRAYSAGFYQFLLTIQDGREFLEKVIASSDRSGAAMRACPIGLCFDIRKTLSVAETQARVTHNTPEGVGSAQVIAAAVHHQARVAGSQADPGFFEYLNQKVPGFGWDASWLGRVSVSGMDCARAALAAFANNASYSKMLVEAVGFEGDTDTVCAMAAGIASVSKRYLIDPPAWMERDFERGPYGMGYLKEQDKALSEWADEQARIASSRA